MRSIKIHNRSFSSLLDNRRINRRLAFFVVLLLSLNMVSTVYADASFGAYTGPVFLNPGYQWTIAVNAMSNPSHNVNLLYTINAVSTCVPCTCSTTTNPPCDPGTGVGTWVCTVPTNFTGGQFVDWNISAYPNTFCNDQTPILGASGSFSVGPTAVELTSFSSDNSKASILSGGSVLLIASFGMLIFLVLVWRLKIQHHAG